MRPLTAQDIIEVWERGQDTHPLDRALHILSPALPGAEWDFLARLTLGQRNTCLYALRGQTFGFTLRAYAECPRCACPLEFSADVRDFCDSERMPNVEREQLLSVGGYELRFRPLDSRDLVAAARRGSLSPARDELIRRCLLEARKGETTLQASELPEEIVAALAEHASDCDPRAETLLGLACAACGHEWTPLLDIASFFWREIAAEAKRLLLAVHTLAGAYGWREADILSMSAVRRQMYLEMVS
ncbi:MAG: hypothetical protein QOJ76_3492 [Acidobacteriota bacterium]|jgi:hypothetical protein|nr:hypothetical protein [Acidobacteriota bacterium]